MATLALMLGGACGASSAHPSPPGRDGSTIEAGAVDLARPRDGAAVEAAGAPAEVAGGPAGSPVCELRFSASTANMTAPEVPMADSCPGERTDDGMGHPFIDFQPGDTQAGVVRTFSIWQFETQAPAGTVLRIEDGFDELAARGVSVRYLEVDGSEAKTWRADRGLVRLASTRDEAYTMELVGVHMIPAVDPTGTNRASGELEVNGTIVSVLP